MLLVAIALCGASRTVTAGSPGRSCTRTFQPPVGFGAGGGDVAPERNEHADRKLVSDLRGDQVSGVRLAGGAEVELHPERDGELAAVQAHLTPARRRTHPDRCQQDDPAGSCDQSRS